MEGLKDIAQANHGKAVNVTDPAGNKTIPSSNGDKNKLLLEDSIGKANDLGSGKDSVGSGKDGNTKPAIEEQLAANSASSTASRHGGSVYDIIVQVDLSLYSL